SFNASANCARRSGSASSLLGTTLSTMVLANRITLGMSVSVSLLSTVRASRDMYCCWLEMRERSLFWPTPCRTRMNCSASYPWIFRAPGGPFDTGVPLVVQSLRSDAHLHAADRVRDLHHPVEAELRREVDVDAAQLRHRLRHARQSGVRVDGV